jgi:hypothetical protein
MSSRTARGSRSRQEHVGIGSWRKSSSTREQGIAFEDLMEIRLESEALQEASEPGWRSHQLSSISLMLFGLYGRPHSLR